MTSAALKIGITGYSNPGGSGVIAGELGRLLARRGHFIHFISDAPPFRSETNGENIRHHAVLAPHLPPLKHPPYTLALAAKMADVSRRFQLDILHVHYALPHAAAGILARAMLGDTSRPKLITTLHGTDVTFVGSAPPLHEATAFCMRASNAVTAVSQSLKTQALEIFPDRVPIHVIPNFVDLSTCAKASARGHSELNASRDVLLAHVSNFRPVKRPIDTVRILAAVHARRPARLLLIGDGPEMSSVWREADRLGVRDRVQAFGTRTDVHALLARSDVFLLPSTEESFGLAALEAMACGVPTVTSDVGGLVDLVMNGENGYRVPVGDTQAMADRVLAILADAATLEFHRGKARKSAELFDAERIVPMYESLYERTLA